MCEAHSKRFWNGFRNLFLIGTGLTLSLAAKAVVVQEIYSFPSLPFPNSVLVQDAAGAFYGTTAGGGDFGAGTIYRATTDGTIQTLVSFDNTNGASPQGGLILGGDGALYGTTYQGGSANYGTVFRTTTDGVLTTLISFNVLTNGAYPQSGLIRGADGAFYGTTISGGPSLIDIGTVFRVTTNGVLTTLASFNIIDTISGGSPAALAAGDDGALYGVTQTGGSNNSGTVFRVTTNGIFTTLTSFTDTNGFKDEVDLVAGSNGTFYGTTFGHQPETSTVFQFNTNGELTTLAKFTNGLRFNTGMARASDGSYFLTTNPSSNETNYYGSWILRLNIGKDSTTLTQFKDLDEYYSTGNGLAFGQDGNLYGNGGIGDNNYGAVFRITTNGDLTQLASFEYTNGYDPIGGLTQAADGLFYGTCQGGGRNNEGTLFRITADGILTTLAIFGGENGDSPQGGFIVGQDGALYGTTLAGGTNYGGTVFRVTTNGVLTTMVSFDGTTESATGCFPTGSLTCGHDGSFYGTTGYGPSNNAAGSVFCVNTNGDLKVLASFSQTNGASPNAALLQGNDGSFYGTTYSGGIYNAGTVFKVTTDGKLTSLVSFDNTNGANPRSGLTPGEDGAFYGTTLQGGSNNLGTVFRITANGNLTTLKSFSYAQQLFNPAANLTADSKGAFYGNANRLFRVTTNGTLTMLATNFLPTYSGGICMIHASDNWYYGTTSSASGSKQGGSIFRMNPSVQMLPLTHNTAAWTVNFNGIPGDSYPVLRATNLSGPWDVLTNATADLNGNGQYRDLHPPSGSAFYWIGLP